jgi:hypothetical protein
MIRTFVAFTAIGLVVVGSIFYGLAGILEQTSGHGEWPA